MNEIETTAKKWGSSIAIVIPSETAAMQKIKEGDTVHVSIEKHSDLSAVFGTLKTGITGQKFKEMCREGWD